MVYTSGAAFRWPFFPSNSRRVQGVYGVEGIFQVYDGNGLRVKKSGAGTGTLYWRSFSGDTVAETDLNGNITSEYMFFAGRRIARRDSSNNVYFYYTDHQGSTTSITAGNGAACYTATFTPYGEEHATQNTCPQNYKFTGYERDAETGLDYAFARYYNSRPARFLSADPLNGDIDNPQSLNRYAYVTNNPLLYVDPLGLDRNNCILNGIPSYCPWVPRGGGGAGGGGIPVYGNGLCVSGGDPNPLDPSGEPVPGSGTGAPATYYSCLVLLGFAPSFAGGNSSGGFFDRLKKAANAVCSVVPDASTIGEGFDLGFGVTGGASGGLVANGRSGELSAQLTGTFSYGLIAHDAYVYLGIIFSAPSNQSTAGPSRGKTIGGERTGFSFTTDLNNVQGTFGASVTPITAANQINYTWNSPAIPYAGYLLQPGRALCKLATGH